MIHTEGIGLDLYKKHVVATLNDFLDLYISTQLAKGWQSWFRHQIYTMLHIENTDIMLDF